MFPLLFEIFPFPIRAWDFKRLLSPLLILSIAKALPGFQYTSVGMVRQRCSYLSNSKAFDVLEWWTSTGELHSLVFHWFSKKSSKIYLMAPMIICRASYIYSLCICSRWLHQEPPSGDPTLLQLFLLLILCLHIMETIQTAISAMLIDLCAQWI